MKAAVGFALAFAGVMVPRLVAAQADTSLSACAVEAVVLVNSIKDSSARISEISRLVNRLRAENVRCDVEGVTPLHAAVALGAYPLVERMVELGADLEARLHDGRTPLLLTTEADAPAIALLLLGKGADLTAVDGHGRNLYHLAAIYDAVRVLDFLLTDPARASQLVQPYGATRTGLHLAVLNGSKRTLEVILDSRPQELNAKDELGATPLDLADAFNLPQAARTLANRGAVHGLSTDDLKSWKSSRKNFENLSRSSTVALSTDPSSQARVSNAVIAYVALVARLAPELEAKRVALEKGLLLELETEGSVGALSAGLLDLIDKSSWYRAKGVAVAANHILATVDRRLAQHIADRYQVPFGDLSNVPLRDYADRLAENAIAESFEDVASRRDAFAAYAGRRLRSYAGVGDQTPDESLRFFNGYRSTAGSRPDSEGATRVANRLRSRMASAAEGDPMALFSRQKREAEQAYDNSTRNAAIKFQRDAWTTVGAAAGASRVGPQAGAAAIIGGTVAAFTTLGDSNQAADERYNASMQKAFKDAVQALKDDQAKQAQQEAEQAAKQARDSGKPEDKQSADAAQKKADEAAKEAQKEVKQPEPGSAGSCHGKGCSDGGSLVSPDCSDCPTDPKAVNIYISLLASRSYPTALTSDGSMVRLFNQASARSGSWVMRESRQRLLDQAWVREALEREMLILVRP